MKIALVSPYDFAHPGGVVTHITNLYHHFVAMGHEVRIIAPTSDVLDVFGNNFIRIGRPRPIPASDSISRVPISLNLGPAIRDVLSREKFDIIHLHEPFVPMLCSAILRFSDARNVGTFHAADGKPGYNLGWPFGRMILRRRRRKLHGRIAVSRPAMQYASKYVPGDYTIIPNGTDIRHFNPDVKPVPEFCDGKLNIVFVSRLERRKGVDYLLPAFREVKSQVPESRLIIVGPGTRLRKGYEDWVRRHNLDDVVFVGGVSYADLPRYYRTADVFCVPATGRESFGMVLVEAMATARPVVATKIDGYASVVTHGEQGLLVPPRDSSALAGALIALLKDEPLRRRMGQKGLLRAKEFSWDVVARRVAEYYRGMLNGHEPASGGNGTRTPAELTPEMPRKAA